MNITIGSLTLTGGIQCYDWSELLASPAKVGRDRRIPGVPGVSARPRVVPELRAALSIRFLGYLNANGTPYVGDAHENVYTLIAALRAVADVTSVQTLQFPGADNADVIVEELTPPRFETPSIATAVLDLTLVDGPLDFSS
jgi:hypothetical protein